MRSIQDAAGQDVLAALQWLAARGSRIGLRPDLKKPASSFQAWASKDELQTKEEPAASDAIGIDVSRKRRTGIWIEVRVLETSPRYVI
jgi:hypothetical protein